MLAGDGIEAGRAGAPAAAGGRERWTEVVQRFGPYVHAVAVDGYALAPADAEALFQEVFVRTWERLARPGGEVGLPGFVAGAARAVAEERGHVAGEHALRRLDDALAVGEAIRRLPCGQQDIARRFFLEQESLPSIAASAGRDVGAVADEVRRARRRVRRELDEARRRRGER